MRGRRINDALGKAALLIWALPGIGVSTVLIVLGNRQPPKKMSTTNARGNYGGR